VNTIISGFRQAKPYAQLLGLLFLLIVGFVFATGLQVLMPMVMDGFEPSAIRLMLAEQGLAQLLMFFLPSCIWVWLFCGNGLSYFKVDLRGSKWILGLAAVAMFMLLMPANDWLTYWNDKWDLGPLGQPMRYMTEQSNRIVEQMLMLTGMGDLILQLFVIALIPALCEELFFRGSLQQILIGWFGNKHVAIIVTSVVFSLAHGDIFGFVPRLLLGLLLGYLFYLSGSIVVNVLAHFFNNAIVVICYYLYHQGILIDDPTSPLMMPWHTTVLCTSGSVDLFVVYFAKRQEEGQKRKK